MFQFLIGAMRRLCLCLCAFAFAVSIPYRCNETLFIPFLKIVYFNVSIPYRCNETSKDAKIIVNRNGFQFLIGAMRLLVRRWC